MYRKYIIFLFYPLAATWGCILFFSFSLQPLRGDLTRLAGYSENQFGWNGPEENFQPPLAEPGILTGLYDVVVNGDSFSLRTTPDRQTPYGSFWTDFLVNRTGLNVGVFDQGRISMAQYLQSESYRSYPPKVLIYETVERALATNLSEIGGPCYIAVDVKGINIAVQPRRVVPKHIWRSQFQFNEQQLGYATDYLKKLLSRSVFGNDATPVTRLSLSRSDLFTNERSSELLVIQDDLVKSRWSSQQWNQIACNLDRMRAEVERNGVTRFVAMIAPDKATTYSDYIAPKKHIPNGTAILAGLSPVPMPRIDLALKAAAITGTKDLYLPNDTHWGTAGASIAADVIARYISDSARQN